MKWPTLGEKSTGSTPRQSNTTIVLNLLESSAVYGLMLSCIMSGRKKQPVTTLGAAFILDMWVPLGKYLHLASRSLTSQHLAWPFVPRWSRAQPFINTSNILLVYISLNHSGIPGKHETLFIRLYFALSNKEWHWSWRVLPVTMCITVTMASDSHIYQVHIQSSDLLTLDDPRRMHEFSHLVYFQNFPLMFTSFSSQDRITGYDFFKDIKLH